MVVYVDVASIDVYYQRVDSIDVDLITIDVNVDVDAVMSRLMTQGIRFPPT